MNNPAPLVSVVILSWNRKNDLRESLTRIGQIRQPALEVIVCDNGSQDGTQAMIHNEFPQVFLIDTGKNLGIEAYNIGFRSARGRYIVILDDDSFPAHGAIERMVARFEADPALGIVAFDVRNASSYDQETADAPQTGDTATTETYRMGFNGAGAGVRREVFQQVGYYPGEFFLYWNEHDLALRVLNAGWNIQFFSDIVSYHKYSPTNRASWRAPFYYCRNAFWLVWKNYPLPQAASLTLKLTRLVVHHSLEQHTFIYLQAMAAAMLGVGRIARLRNPVHPAVARAFRVSLELSFTFYR